MDEVLFLEPDNRAAMVLKMIQLANRNRGQELLRLAGSLALRAPIFSEMHYLLGRYRSFALRVAEPFNADELKAYCQSLLDR